MPFIDELLSDQKESEQKKEKLNEQNIAILDIETGHQNMPEWNVLQGNIIAQEIEKQTYKWRADWKNHTNENKKKEFEAEKNTRMERAINNISYQNNAGDPWLNKILISGINIGLEEDFEQYEIITLDEKEIVQRTFDLIAGKEVFTYSPFDTQTLKLKAIKYGIEIPSFHFVDVMKILGSYWGYKKEIVSQDVLAIAFNIKPVMSTLDKSTFSASFDSYNNALTFNPNEIDSKEIREILEMNKLDVLTLTKIVKKAKRVGAL